MGGYALGLSRTAATEFSFFLAIPVMFAATGYDLLKSLNTLTAADVPFFAVGFLVSFVSALAIVKVFRRIRLQPQLHRLCLVSDRLRRPAPLVGTLMRLDAASVRHRHLDHGRAAPARDTGRGGGNRSGGAGAAAGRGSRGRSWHSPRGGLWLSVLLRPAAAADVLSLRVGLAVETALRSLAPDLHLALKWPNDLMLDDRKVGGILCEARWQGDALGWVAVGLGTQREEPDPGGVAGRRHRVD